MLVECRGFLNVKKQMTDLHLLHESIVDETEIDSLGHMNVRYYMFRVARANVELMKRSGVFVRKNPNQLIRRVDTYSRFRTEQFAGAKLNTLGGFIATEQTDRIDGATAYFEIRNPDSGDVAASFVITSDFVDVSTQEPIDASTTIDSNSKYLVEIPDYGRPRSLSLAKPDVGTLEEIEPVISDEQVPGMMSGRHENVVYTEDCDDRGRLREEIDLMFVLHRRNPDEEDVSFGPPEFRDLQGRRYSWAVMETRSVVFARPEAGNKIVSLGADTAYGEKWRQSRRWMFVKDTGQLLGISDTVGICIDLDARKAIPIPEATREAIERNYLPQFA